MSLKPIESKRKVAEIHTGTHLVCISDMKLLRDNANMPMLISGFNAIVVQFKDGQNKLHENLYVIDNDFRQKYFVNMLRAAQVPSLAGMPKKADAIGKRLWISIQECHTVDDDVVVLNPITKEPEIDYYIFKVYPFIEGSRKPAIKGDPEENNGIPEDPFITYKNISSNKKELPIIDYSKEESIRRRTKEEIKMVGEIVMAQITETLPDLPDFGDKEKNNDDEIPVF